MHHLPSRRPLRPHVDGRTCNARARRVKKRVQSLLKMYLPSRRPPRPHARRSWRLSHAARDLLRETIKRGAGKGGRKKKNGKRDKGKKNEKGSGKEIGAKTYVFCSTSRLTMFVKTLVASLGTTTRRLSGLNWWRELHSRRGKTRAR